MPIWTYRCDKCGHIEEVLQLGRNDVDAARPECCAACEWRGSFEMVVTPLGAMHFKGPGFHVNDYRKKMVDPRKRTTGKVTI